MSWNHFFSLFLSSPYSSNHFFFFINVESSQVRGVNFFTFHWTSIKFDAPVMLFYSAKRTHLTRKTFILFAKIYFIDLRFKKSKIYNLHNIKYSSVQKFYFVQLSGNQCWLKYISILKQNYCTQILFKSKYWKLILSKKIKGRCNYICIIPSVWSVL